MTNWITAPFAGDYALLFGIGSAALLLAFATDLLAGYSAAARAPSGSSAT
jgi:hypothetical protein